MKNHKDNGENKRPLPLEDLRHHSPEQLAELRLLLESGTPLEPIHESTALFAVEGPFHVFYVCENHAHTEILLIVARKRRQLFEDPDPAHPQPTAVGEENLQLLTTGGKPNGEIPYA